MSITESQIQLVGHGSSKPSLKASMYTYCANRYKNTGYKTGVSQSTWDGIPTATKAALGMTYSGGKVTWHKGLVRVLRPVGLTDANSKICHDKYKTILGRNNYTNTSKRSYVYTPYTDGKYYSDCSSSVSTTHKLCVNSSIGCLHTPSMMVSKYYEEVDVTIKNGHITSGIEKLRSGDALMFAGGDWGRLKYQIVGHTEMVYGKTDGSLLLDSNAASTITATTAATSTTFARYKVKVTVSDNDVLYIRKGPSTSYDKVGYLKNSHVAVTIREESNGWGRVDCLSDKDGSEVKGWICLKYTSKA